MIRSLAAALISAILLPATAEAKEYGDFRPGETFTKRVYEKTSKRYRLWDTDKVSVPKDVPDYRHGSRVRFVIGKRGQLTGPDGLYLRYRYDSNDKNHYFSETAPNSNEGVVRKGSWGNPRTVRLHFVRVDWDWFGPETTIVTYKLR